MTARAAAEGVVSEEVVAEEDEISGAGALVCCLRWNLVVSDQAELVVWEVEAEPLSEQSPYYSVVQKLLSLQGCS